MGRSQEELSSCLVVPAGKHGSMTKRFASWLESLGFSKTPSFFSGEVKRQHVEIDFGYQKRQSTALRYHETCRSACVARNCEMRVQNRRMNTVKLPLANVRKDRDEDISACPRSINNFVFDINIQVRDAGTDLVVGKIAKRVLLDTGADINLISASAHRDLGSVVQSRADIVYSLSGPTPIAGETTLCFNFMSTSSQSVRNRTIYTETFSLLSSSEQPQFDAIVGRGWIISHWEEFLMLVASRI